MKKIAILTLALLSLTGMQAGNIQTGTHWYNGSSQFEATDIGGFIRMYEMSEGEESAFMLVPVDEDWRAFSIRPAKGYEDAFYMKGTTAKYLSQDGYTVITVYDEQERLMTVFRKTTSDVEVNTVATRIAEIRGAYSQDKTGGPDVLIDERRISIGSVSYDYEVVTFNGFATNFIRIKDGAWRGLWDLKATREGWNVYESVMDEYGMAEHKVGGRKTCLIWKDPECSRWDFASQMILSSPVLYHFRKSTLRLMRNAILARYGYVFSSPDLKQYFDAQPWYTPRESNDGIQLSFVEQLNVQLIKYFEADADHDKYASEEEVFK